MKPWEFKVRNTPQEIIEKLDSAIGSAGGFAFRIDHSKADSVKFTFRKRVLYPDQILHRNRIVVQGTALKSDTEIESDVRISFAQHFATTVTAYMLLGTGLFALILAFGKSASAYIPAGILIALGTTFWLALMGKFKRDVHEYKTLISEILDFK